MAQAAPNQSTTGTVGVSQRPARSLGFYALCGVIAPVFFAVIVLAEGFLDSGYSQVSQPISDLGAYALYGSNALLQNVNFWIFGLLVITFSLGLHRSLLDARGVTISLGLFGALVFLAGVFPDQPSPWPGSVHSFVSVVAFLSIILCQFLAWRRIHSSGAEDAGRWGRYGTYSLISGVVSIVALVAYSILGQPGSPMGGIMQRVFLSVPWLWIEVMSLRLLRISKM